MADQHGHDVIVIGSSAGGIDALQRLCAGLPRDLPAAVLVVQHLSPTSPSVLPLLLSRAGDLPASTPTDGEAVLPGHIYVAPPDLHLLLVPGRMLLRRGPRENRMRPAADALFRSAAVAYGPRVVGLVLTGLLDDGTEGLIAIKRAGGITAVQDPQDAAWPGMPRHAIAHDHVEHSLPLARLPDLLSRLARQPAGEAVAPPPELIAEARIAEGGFASTKAPGLGIPSPFSCPDCGGVLNDISDDGLVRFRCQVGHAFNGDALTAAQNDGLERALGVAMRTHRDRLSLFNLMEAEAVRRDRPHAAARWRAAAREAGTLARVLEDALVALVKPADPLE